MRDNFPYSTIFFKTKNKLLTVQFFQATKSPHFPLRGKVGQPSKRERMLCWSIILLVCVCGAHLVAGGE